MNHFEKLGLQPRLVISEEELRAAFRTAGKTMHPDGGGSEIGFSSLQSAYGSLSSPAQRLKNWLEVHGVEVQLRGEIDGNLVDLFSEISHVLASSQEVIRRRESAQSALAKAMLEREVHSCMERIEQSIGQIDEAIFQQCHDFSAIEQTIMIDANTLSARYRNLVFLEKWRAQLNSTFSQMLA